MKTKLQTTKIYLIVLSLFILGCRLLSEGIATPADADLPPTDQESQPVVTPEEETEAITAPAHPGFFTPFGTYSYEGGVITGTGIGGPYEVEYSGTICSLEQPFTLTELTGTYSELQFTPSGAGEAGSVSISGGWMLERSSEGYTDEGNYTVADNQSDPSILEGNLGLHIITSPECLSPTDPVAGLRTPTQGCFPGDSWIYLTPLETTECAQP